MQQHYKLKQQSDLIKHESYRAIASFFCPYPAANNLMTYCGAVPACAPSVKW
jgi:hypothetical protein